MARVLILEDDEAIGYVLTRILTLLGHETRAVTGLARAREALAQPHGFDVFFVDLHVPGGPSTQLFDDPELELPACVLMSATGGVGLDADAARIAAAYGVPFLPKYLDQASVEAAFTRAAKPTRGAHAISR